MFSTCVKQIIKYCPKVIIRELPDGISNLHRFEIKHMLDYDPNLNTKTKCYDASKFKQKKINSKQDIFDLYQLNIFDKNIKLKPDLIIEYNLFITNR